MENKILNLQNILFERKFKIPLSKKIYFYQRRELKKNGNYDTIISM